MTQENICGPTPWLAKKSTAIPGIVIMPSKAAAPYEMRRFASIRHLANHSASTVPVQASQSEKAIRLVFIETVNASPTKSPAPNARRTVAWPVTRTASTISQSAVQSSSGRYSTEVRKREEKTPLARQSIAQFGVKRGRLKFSKRTKSLQRKEESLPAASVARCPHERLIGETKARLALEKAAYDYRKCRDKEEVPASKPTLHADAAARRNLFESGSK
jgi:hypothetical protein